MLRPKLDILARAVVATSERVRREDVTSLQEVVAGLAGSTQPAGNFDELASQVQATSPSLIVLLPHSLLDPNVVKMAALELGGQVVNSAQLTHEYVLGPNSECGPVVLLLGCSTELPELPYQKFVERFKDAGASIVLATMSPATTLQLKCDFTPPLSLAS